jgi:hypothetical protein
MSTKSIKKFNWNVNEKKIKRIDLISENNNKFINISFY